MLGIRAYCKCSNLSKPKAASTGHCRLRCHVYVHSTWGSEMVTISQTDLQSIFLAAQIFLPRGLMAIRGFESQYFSCLFNRKGLKVERAVCPANVPNRDPKGRLFTSEGPLTHLSSLLKNCQTSYHHLSKLLGNIMTNHPETFFTKAVGKGLSLLLSTLSLLNRH